MTWKPELDELRRREGLAEQLGGVDKVERQHHFGKLTVRERVEQIVDQGSFWEIGKTAGVARYGSGTDSASSPSRRGWANSPQKRATLS